MGRKAAGGIKALYTIMGMALLFAVPVSTGFGGTADSDSATAEALASLPRDAQDRIKAEADDVQQECTEDMTYRNYHDCRCLRGKFVAARLADPNRNRSNITFHIRAECVNEPAIKSYNYDFCFKKTSRMMPSTKTLDDTRRADYCKCFADGMADKYSSAPDPRHSTISNMQVDVLNTCLPK